MVRKLKSLSQKKTASTGMMDGQVAGAVKDSAQQIWLAGMGAFAKAQEEGGKVFDALVKEGMNLQKKTQGMAEDKISEVTGKMSAMAETVTNRAGQNWDKLETLFEQRTAKALSKLGVPTAKDVDALVKRVDALTAEVAKLNGKTPAAKAARPAAKKAAAKPAAKAAAKAAKKAASKRTAGKRAAGTPAAT